MMVAKGILNAPLLEIVNRLPLIERAMVIGSGQGTTHERIGRIETVTLRHGWIALGGAVHTASFEADLIATVYFDSTGGMQDKIIPRLEFRDAADDLLFQISVLSGLEGFDAALGDLMVEAALPERSEPSSAALALSDPSPAVFEDLQAKGLPVVLTYQSRGFVQAWTGVITAVKPAMGFLNIMTPDFHLHLKEASVGEWQEVLGQLIALDPEGAPTGLSVHRLPS